jgi:anti-sigma B factor antagonist
MQEIPMSASTEDPPTAARKQPKSRGQRPDEPGSYARGPELDAQFEWRGDVLVVHLTGELDIYTVPSLRRQIARHDRPQTALVVDLLRVELIDSCGLGLLVSLRNHAAVTERRIALVLVNPRLRNILRITGLTDAFVQSVSVDLACAAVSEPPTQGVDTES